MSNFQKYKHFFIHSLYPHFMNTCYQTNTFKIVQPRPETCSLYLRIQYFLNYRGSASSFLKNEVNSDLSKSFSIYGSHYIKAQLYHDTMKFYLGMSKLVHIVKLRYQPIYNDKNLYLQEINKDKSVILNENNTNYVFEYCELYKICKSAITYTDESHMLSVQQIKNPYTNLPFSSHNIYNIYFTLEQNKKLPYVFNVFYKINFNIRQVYTDYNFIFLKEALKLKYNNFNINQKCSIIKDMVEDYYYDSFANLSEKMFLSLFDNIGRTYFIMRELEKQSYPDLYEFERKISKYLCLTQNKYPKLGRKIYYRNPDKSYSYYIYVNPTLLSHFSD